MDISRFSTEDLLLAAIKSEVEAEEVYSKLADRVKNSFLKERLRFLATEELKHREYIEGLYRHKIGKNEIVLPDKTPVPLPEIVIGDENEPISLVLESAMEAEKAAKEFYEALSERFEDAKTGNMLRVLAKMEEGHYNLLNQELANARMFEEYDTAWPMMHVGP